MPEAKFQNYVFPFEKHITRPCEESKLQHFNRFLKKKSEYFENEVFVNLSDIKVYFSQN